MKRWIPVLCLAVFFSAAFLAISRAYSGADEFDVAAHYTKSEFRIPMRDGVRLFTAVYVPRDSSVQYPILITRTPYGVAPYGADAYPRQIGPSRKLAESKYIFVYQDVRGRFMSEGEFVEMRPEKDVTNGPADVDESTDTYDTIDWLVKNVPQNNGKVGLTGISYPGFYTSAGLINAHPALVAASPQAPMTDLFMGDDAYHNGAFFLLANFSFYTFFGKQNNPEPPAPERPFDYGTNNAYQFFLQMGSLMNSEKYFEHKNPYWTDLLNHTTYDDFWKSKNISPHLKAVKPAVLVVGGWFDAEDLSGTLKTFRAIEEQSPVTADKLVMGPWVHGGWARGAGEKLGDISFDSKTSVFFQDEIEFPFFEHYLKGAPDPALPKAYVFETGKNVWHKENHWPPQGAVPQRFYFDRSGTLTLQLPVENDAFDQYTSDPQTPVQFWSKPTVEMTREYMDADQRFVDKRPDVLTYQTEPLREDLTVAGPISPSLFVSSTGTDSDFVVKVIDVFPKNAPGTLSAYEELIRGEPFRGKFRKSFERPEAFESGEIQQIRFTMPDVYHCFRTGHRIMVQVQSSWFPLVDRNPQTFTNIPTANPTDFVKATERVYRSRKTASFVEMDVEH